MKLTNLQFGGALLGTTFKEQSLKWEDLVLSHVSDAIVVVHYFIVELLDTIVPEKQVKAELWDNVLLENLQATYKKAMGHARFLLTIEREGKPITYNHYFNANLQKGQAERLQQALSGLAVWQDGTGPVVSLEMVNQLSINKSNPEHVRENLHDILKSYYKVSVKRFVDIVCQQVIDHFLLNSQDGPVSHSLIICLTIEAPILTPCPLCSSTSSVQALCLTFLLASWRRSPAKIRSRSRNESS